jgi:hypothetical protein
MLGQYYPLQERVVPPAGNLRSLTTSTAKMKIFETGLQLYHLKASILTVERGAHTKTFLHILKLYIIPIHENTIVNTTTFLHIL